jgi:hypothetical protein
LGLEAVPNGSVSKSSQNRSPGGGLAHENFASTPQRNKKGMTVIYTPAKMVLWASVIFIAVAKELNGLGANNAESSVIYTLISTI